MPSTLQKFRQERADLTSETRTLLDRAKDAGRDVTDAEKARAAQTLMRLRALEIEIPEEERLMELERLAESGGHRVPDRTAPLPAAQAERDARRLATIGGVETPRSSVRRGHSFAAMFGAPAANDLGGFASSSEFLSIIGKGLHDPRIRAAAGGMNESVGSEGGFSVPTAISARWLDLAIEAEIVRSRASVWPMTSREQLIPAWDHVDGTGGQIAGILASWVAEGGEIPKDVAKVRRLQLIAKKLGLMAEATSELVQDGVGFDRQLDSIMARAVSRAFDTSFLWGTGAGMPLGVFNSGALITVPAESGQDADSIVYENLVRMYSRLAPASVGQSVWIAHPSTIPQLSMLTINVGTGGAHVLAQGADGSFTILTRPVIFSDRMKPLGDLGDILLADFSQYVIGLRKEVSIDKSIHPGFSRDMVTFRVLMRGDGQPSWTTAYTPETGADTLSPFVTLAAR